MTHKNSSRSRTTRNRNQTYKRKCNRNKPRTRLRKSNRRRTHRPISSRQRGGIDLLKGLATSAIMAANTTQNAQLLLPSSRNYNSLNASNIPFRYLPPPPPSDHITLSGFSTGEPKFRMPPTENPQRDLAERPQSALDVDESDNEEESLLAQPRSTLSITAFQNNVPTLYNMIMRLDEATVKEKLDKTGKLISSFFDDYDDNSIDMPLVRSKIAEMRVKAQGNNNIDLYFDFLEYFFGRVIYFSGEEMNEIFLENAKELYNTYIKKRKHIIIYDPMKIQRWKSNFFYNLQLLRNIKTLAENDNNEYLEFIHYTQNQDSLEELGRIILESYKQQQHLDLNDDETVATDERVPIIISDDITYSGKQMEITMEKINGPSIFPFLNIAGYNHVLSQGQIAKSTKRIRENTTRSIIIDFIKYKNIRYKKTFFVNNEKPAGNLMTPEHFVTSIMGAPSKKNTLIQNRYLDNLLHDQYGQLLSLPVVYHVNKYPDSVSTSQHYCYLPDITAWQNLKSSDLANEYKENNHRTLPKVKASLIFQNQDNAHIVQRELDDDNSVDVCLNFAIKPIYKRQEFKDIITEVGLEGFEPIENNIIMGGSRTPSPPEDAHVSNSLVLYKYGLINNELFIEFTKRNDSI